MTRLSFTAGHSFENTSDPVRQNESAIATALAYGLKAGLLHPPGKLAFGDDSYVPFSEPSASNTLSTQEVPGITAVVYEEFFTKASAVAVQLLEVGLQMALNQASIVADGHQGLKCISSLQKGTWLNCSTTHTASKRSSYHFPSYACGQRLVTIHMHCPLSRVEPVSLCIQACHRFLPFCRLHLLCKRLAMSICCHRDDFCIFYYRPRCL